MKKYILLIVVVLILGAGVFAWQKFSQKDSGDVKATGREVSFTVHALKEQWSWDLQDMKVQAGDHVSITFVNEDNFDHGVGLAVFGINQKIPANSTVVVDFVANRRGKFDFYCTIPCGQGVVAGKTRDHFDMVGTLEVS